MEAEPALAVAPVAGVTVSGVPLSATANTWIRPADWGSPVWVGRVTDATVLPAGMVSGAVANSLRWQPSVLVPLSLDVISTAIVLPNLAEPHQSPYWILYAVVVPFGRVVGRGHGPGQGALGFGQLVADPAGRGEREPLRVRVRVGEVGCDLTGSVLGTGRDRGDRAEQAPVGRSAAGDVLLARPTGVDLGGRHERLPVLWGRR